MQAQSIYIDHPSALHQLNPLTKLTFTLVFLVAAFALPNAVALIATFVLILVPLAASGGLLLPLLRSAFWLVLPFAISLALIQGFFSPGQTALFSLGPFTMTLEGLGSGLTFAARLLLALGGTLLLMLSTRPDKLMLALRQRGLPESLSYIVLTALQIFPRFQERARTILDAQKSRGLETEVGLLRRLALLVPLIAPLVLGSIVEVEERAMALEARAFSYKTIKTSWISLEDSRAQSILRAAILFFGVVLVYLRLTGFWPQ
ncbi:MAG: energy-coupling factor transporter transmembrane protein EcfT [Chloroflexi bacterium]|nr:energy-coupling factor transporter transmembrane component T [Chloroflexota bacterium]MQC26349.1 energy-coupling factor transporter transmembrane protein EcfT [Chloroflexota bacterium]